MSQIVITGSSSGVGAALASTLVQQSHQVVGIARNAERLQQQASDLGDSFQYIAADLGNTEEIPSLNQHILNTCQGAPDVLIHNAGIFHLGDFDAMPARRIEEIYRVNTLAPMLLTQALLPAMKNAELAVLLLSHLLLAPMV